MKKVYETPELYVFSVIAEDILTESGDNEFDIGDLVDVNQIAAAQESKA